MLLPGPAQITSGLVVQTNYIGANVTMVTPNQFYDGPSLALAAGTWLLFAVVNVNLITTTGEAVTCKIWDGTTAYGSGEFSPASGGNTISDLVFTVPGVAVLAAPATLKASTACVGANNIMLRTVRNNNTGLTSLGCGLIAVKVA